LIDEDIRGKPVVAGVLGYIKEKQPSCFVLENVTGLVHQHRHFFNWIIKQLSDMVDSAGSSGQLWPALVLRRGSAVLRRQPMNVRIVSSHCQPPVTIMTQKNVMITMAIMLVGGGGGWWWL
jgi:hypothetical protein